MEHNRNQHSGARLLKKAAWLYVAGIHLMLAILVFKPDFVDELKNRLLPAQEYVNALGQRMMILHERMDASVPAGAAIFLGDSITQGLATAAVAPFSVNYGISSATTQELLQNIPKYRSLNRASAIFLMIGINDIDQNKFTGLADRLRTIANAIPHDRTLIWSGIMPVYTDSIQPEQIAHINEAIEQICSQRSKCTFVNTQEVFGSGGESLFSDGVHLNDAGYSKWIPVLRQSYEKAIKDQPSN
jgi:hypothetical protein